MLKPIEGLGDNVVGFEADGIVTVDDYAERLVPAVERALEHGPRPRFMYVIGPRFEKFELGAAFADAKVGMRHFNDFERIAIVTDRDWIAHTAGAFGALMPCPVRTFEYDELEDAKTWIAEPSTNEFHLDVERADSVAQIHVKLRGSLDREAEEQLIKAVKSGIGDAEELRVLVEASDFHGWSELRALWQHIRFIAGQRAKLERVAIVGDANWQRRLVTSAKHVLRIDAKFFDPGRLDEARAWLQD